jgi:RNA polymerase sigma factor (sigma-70 family)
VGSATASPTPSCENETRSSGVLWVMDGYVGWLEAAGSVRPPPDLVDSANGSIPGSPACSPFTAAIWVWRKTSLKRHWREHAEIGRRSVALGLLRLGPIEWQSTFARPHFRRKAIEAMVKRLLQPSPPAVVDEPSPEGAFLLQVIRKLPHRQRSALLLHYYFDLPVREVAEILDCPEGTVKTLVHRAREAVRKGYDESAKEENL